MPRWNPHKDKDQGALDEALQLQEEAARLSFDWPDIGPVWEKMTEELGELREAVEARDADAISHEFGDVMFTLINMSRFLKLPPEKSLQQANSRFKQRLNGVQKLLDEQSRTWTDASLEELEELWQQAKKGG